jgi:hypothetical protein
MTPIQPLPAALDFMAMRVRQAIIAALRHCQGMGYALPLSNDEIDALCKRLGDQQ